MNLCVKPLSCDRVGNIMQWKRNLASKQESFSLIQALPLTGYKTLKILPKLSRCLHLHNKGVGIHVTAGKRSSATGSVTLSKGMSENLTLNKLLIYFYRHR